MIGQKLGSFRIEAKVGSGAMGVVYRAVHEPSGRPVAVKVITGEQARKSSAYDRFEREAEILQKLKHPNIVRFLGVGRFQGTNYFAMEFVEGRTLEAVLEQSEHGYLPWLEVVTLGAQVCEALHYAHGFRVVHRDLKPSNIMITDDGRVKLTDFGIAKDIDRTALTAEGRTLGTAAYMAPEQISGTPEVSHKTDLYALGCLFYQMLTGVPPFQGNTVQLLMFSHLKDPAPRPSDKLLDIPRELDDLIVQLMAKAPADRPWDAELVAAKLADLRDRKLLGEPIAMVWPEAGGNGTATGATSILPTTGKKKKRKKRRRNLAGLDAPWVETAGLVAALAALLAFVAYMLWPPSAEYLHRHARALMASEDRGDWKIADADYIKELERRYPNNKYKDEIASWHDRIAVEDARNKGFNLLRKLRQPQSQAEQRYLDVYNEAEDYRKDFRDVEAAEAWRNLAAALKDVPESRGWYLLVLERVDEFNRVVAERRKTAEARIEEADKAVLNGQLDDARKIRRDIVDHYARYPELADVVRRAKKELAADEPEAAPKAAGPDKASP
jgi:serine/threonine-protein kinase